jgi:hypothetical protein
LQIDLSHLAELPLRWVKGDTPSHQDTGEAAFENTYLVYLTSSVGKLIIDKESYPITAGNAHIFNEGLQHSTTLTGNGDRLMIGPMSETGDRVGGSATVVFLSFMPASFDDAVPYFLYGQYIENLNYGNITIFDIPPPIPDTVPGSFFIDNESNPEDWAPPAGTTFGGWKFAPYPDTIPLENNDLSKIYLPGETYALDNFLTVLYAYWIPTTSVPRSVERMQLQFTNNAQVFYKPHSHAAGSGGVRNHRFIKRKT